MKSKRHNRILEIINKKEIETQEELAEELKKIDFDVDHGYLKAFL